MKPVVKIFVKDFPRQKLAKQSKFKKFHSGWGENKPSKLKVDKLFQVFSFRLTHFAQIFIAENNDNNEYSEWII